MRRHGTTGRPPIELFDEEEREALLPLPKTRWERVVWRKATLHTDSEKLNEWIFFFLNTLRKQVSVLTSKIEMAEVISELPPLSREILHITSQQGGVTVRDAGKITGEIR